MKQSQALIWGFSLLFSLQTLAQTVLPMDAPTMRRLGLVFVRLSAPDSQSGAVSPARIISSPYQHSEVVSLYDGVLLSWEVEPGQTVAAGTLLGLVRSPQVLALQQDWLTARAQEQQSAAQLQRDKSLFADGVISASRLQLAERDYRSVQIALQSATARLETAGFTAEARNALATQQAQLGYYRVLASSEGEVSHLLVMPGQAVSAGDKLAAVNSVALWISAEVPARLAVNLQPGQKLMMQGEATTLTLRQQDQALDSDSQTIGILAEFDGPVDRMPGQIVNLVLPAVSEGVLVPADAVVHNGKQTTVYVKTAAGIESRNIQLQVLGSNYLATSGIQNGEEVVVRGAAILKGVELGLGGE